MKQLESLMETGVYETLAPSKAMTVHDLLKELNLNRDGLLTVLVNGKKARLDDEITPKDEICVIPMIAGGQESKIKFKKLEMSLLEDQRIEFDIESNKGNAHGEVPSFLILSLLNGFLGEKEKSTLQKCFSNILIETFKPITDFIERYGLENTARFTQILVKEMASVYEQTILFNDDFRMWLFLSQKKKYFGW